MNSKYGEYFNAYKILNIRIGASATEIRSAYRKKARSIHPDKNRGSDEKTAHENFTKLRNAYTILCDEVKRKKFEDYYNKLGVGQERSRSTNADDSKHVYRREMEARKSKRKSKDKSNSQYSEEYLNRLREESLDIINIYQDMLDSNSKGAKTKDQLDTILKQTLDETDFNKIVEEFHLFEKTVLEKLKIIATRL